MHKRYGIGRRDSHGYIRPYQQNIETPFWLVSVDTPVTVVDQPARVGWHEGERNGIVVGVTKPTPSTRQ